ncbi:hypothetical protein M433DRAFT_65774 [Acidomyces richmondensis BFW]|nr:MAG: hypothetical protein FE78DRAFT_146485 [Acidomyces sp. 'richmondensis']KYG46135.1 hypothetical protein M433DRAFT_65774 [Acidomyces richmondensis BFW]
MAISKSLNGLPLLICITVVNSVSMAWFGYDQGVFSGVLISKDFIKHFPQTKNANISGITSSCFSLGAFCGCLFAFTFGDKLGRRKTVLAGVTCNVVGAVLQISSFQLPQMIIGRVINGFGMGVTSSVCPVYQAEVSPFKARGRLVALGSVCNTVAVCISTWMNYALHNGSGPFQWRFPLAFQLVFPILVLSCLPFSCESPRWLLLRDRHEEALVNLGRLRGLQDNLDDEELVYEFKSIFQTIQEERADRAEVSDVFRFNDRQQNLKRVILACGTQFMQQFSGVNALGYYLPTLLEKSVGVSSTQARLLTAANATIYLLAALICLVIIDYVGRRILMLYGAATIGSWYLIAAITLRQAGVHPEEKKTLGSVTTTMFFLYYFCYGTSWAKIPWVYNSEVNSLGWRSRGAAAATATNWMGSFIVTQFTKTGVEHLHWRFYLMFSIFCYSFFPISYCFYPETSKRTLEDMDQIFARGKTFVFTDQELVRRQRPQTFVDAELARTQQANVETTIKGGDVVLVEQTTKV